MFRQPVLSRKVALTALCIALMLISASAVAVFGQGVGTSQAPGSQPAACLSQTVGLGCVSVPSPESVYSYDQRYHFGTYQNQGSSGMNLDTQSPVPPYLGLNPNEQSNTGTLR